jgi:hypothetical protein
VYYHALLCVTCPEVRVRLQDFYYSIAVGPSSSTIGSIVANSTDNVIVGVATIVVTIRIHIHIHIGIGIGIHIHTNVIAVVWINSNALVFDGVDTSEAVL